MHSLLVSAHVLDLDRLGLVLLHCSVSLLLLACWLNICRGVSVIEKLGLIWFDLLAIMHCVSASVVSHHAGLLRHIAEVVW
jgi:hypothetical protein